MNEWLVDKKQFRHTKDMLNMLSLEHYINYECCFLKKAECFFNMMPTYTSSADSKVNYILRTHLLV